MLAKVQDIQGCKGMKAAPIHKIGDELSFRSCVGNYVKPQFSAFIDAFNRYQAGVMPYSGGLMEQPAKIIGVFNLIEQNIAERQAREHKKAELIARQRGGQRG